MLFGKISPQAIIPQMVTPFEQTQIIAEYITAIASPYKLGDNSVNFTVMYINFDYNQDNVPVSYQTCHTVSVRISGSTIENWGTDDSFILNAIATEQGTTITEFVNLPL